MHNTSDTKITSTKALHAFINEFTFGVIVSSDLNATHLPFILDKALGSENEQTHAEFGTLYSHFAKTNSHWQSLSGKEVVVIFNGPQAYISPTWYATPPNVPTWNYAAVHAYGTLEILGENENIRILEKTIEKFEPELLTDPTIITEQFRGKLLSHIVSFKINIERIEGKQKLGQHRSSQDQQGVVAGLRASGNSDADNLLSYMFKKGIGTGK